MKTALTFLLVLLLHSPAGTQDLPPDILADQYLLEASKALEKDDIQAALQAFRKIEALEVEPPPEFAFFYGKMLVEHGMAPGELLKGQALLKEFVISAGRDSAHYTPALELLSEVRPKLKVSLLAMVRVEGGNFTMGCTPKQEPCLDFEYPAHQVQVRSFEISRYEVTWAFWEFVMGEKHLEGSERCSSCPARSLTWNETQAFLQKLNAGGGQYRLPSEAEWEYAARGGAQSQGYRYAGSDNPDAVAWYKKNSEDSMHAVSEKQANELDLYDMSGNAWEWVQDCYHKNYEGAPTDGRAWESGDCDTRILRGGSSLNNSMALRSASRHWFYADGSYSSSGFRLARSLP